jgi:hypothetical protein
MVLRSGSVGADLHLPVVVQEDDVAAGRTIVLGAICYQIDTKTWQVGSGLNRGGSAPFISFF